VDDNNSRLNPLKRFWLRWFWLSAMDRSFVRCHSHHGREKQDQLILDTAKEKTAQDKLNNLIQAFWENVWVLWFLFGVPMIPAGMLSVRFQDYQFPTEYGLSETSYWDVLFTCYLFCWISYWIGKGVANYPGNPVKPDLVCTSCGAMGEKIARG